MTDMREEVRAGYAQVARNAGGCGGASIDTIAHAKNIGYTADELAHIPDDANLGLGCGNPTALATMKPGEVVLDLGSGAGMDAFLAANQVTDSGRVIGVDMTREMLAKARKNAVDKGVESFVEFREGFIEALPVVSRSVDHVISNCVINLSPDKSAVFKEAFRVLKPGGTLAVSDICLTGELPASVREDVAAWVACVGGASHIEDYLAALEGAGFVNVETSRVSAGPVLDTACCEPTMGEKLRDLQPEVMNQLAETVWSYKIKATRPESDDITEVDEAPCCVEQTAQATPCCTPTEGK